MMPRKAKRGEAQLWLDELLARPDHGKECIIWPFYLKGNGYGQIGSCRHKQHPHRVVCAATHGPPRFDRAEAAHSCNNRACCNRNHLSWKTHAANQQDRVAHGTALRGEQIATAKLKADEVVLMRTLYAEGGYTHEQIATLFDVAPATAGMAIQRKTWAWLKEPVDA